MSNVKISGLTAYTNPAVSDVLPIVDLLNDQTKKITISDLLKSGFGPGTVSLPSFSFIGDPDTGIYSPGANQFAVTTGGTQRLLIDASGNTTIQGDLTVNGTTTTVSSNTLSIKDKNIEIAVVSTPTDTTADGGGITLKGATDKTLTWVDSTDCWTFNQGLNLTAGTAGAPALVFNGDVNSGLFQPGADSLAIATGGTQRVTVDSSGRVGIGTSSPSAQLHVSSPNSAAFVRITSGNSSTALLDLGKENDLDGGRIAYDANNNLLFQTASTEKLRITSAGNVGIGTSSPATSLHISAASPRITFTDTDTGVDHRINADSGAGNLAFDVDINSESSAPSCIFNIKGSEKLRIKSDGNVGIGTTSPTSLLNVNGTDTTAKIHLHSTNSGISIFDPEKASISLTATGMNTTNKYTPSINFGSTDPQFTTTNPKFGAAINAQSTETYALDTRGGMKLNFWTSPNNPGTGHGLVQRMTIAENGNVGIGTTSPAAKFAVDLNATGTIAEFRGADTDLLHIDGDSNQITLDARNVGALAFEMQGSEAMRIDSSGKVIIGGTSPLTSSSQLTLTSSTTSGGLGILSPNNGRGDIFFGDAADDNVGQIRYSHVDNSFTIRTNASDRFKIDSSGNVGIEIADPGEKLDVNGKIRSHHASDSRFLLRVNDVNKGGFSATTDDGVVIYGASSTNPIRFQVSGGEKARIDTSGRLLVGLTSSSAGNTAVFQGNSSGSAFSAILNLAVGNATPSNNQELGILSFSDSGHDRAAEIFAARDGGTWTSNSSQPTRLVFSTTADGASSPTERMRIDSSGRVGIGATPGSQEQFIVHGGDNSIYVPFARSNTRWLTIHSGGTDPGIFTNNGAAIRFGHGANRNGFDTEKMRLDSSGRVGIGTTSPQDKLHVNGTIRDSIGPLRRLNVAGKSSNFTLTAANAGSLLRRSGGNATIPSGVFTPGDMITIFNAQSSNMTILRSGVQLYNTADGTNANRTLASQGMCTIVCTATNEFAISGSQLT